MQSIPGGVIRVLVLPHQMVTLPSKSSEHQVAVVDDDLGVRRAVGRVLTAAGYSVRLFQSGEDFLADDAHYECVVLDVQLPKQCGIEVERRLRVAKPRTAVVFLTACSEEKKAMIARQTGRLCLQKPADERVLIEAVARASEGGKLGR
jgi:two-component system, LuxR family, response regulator FixJ